jgi:hypothetical protein
MFAIPSRILVVGLSRKRNHASGEEPLLLGGARSRNRERHSLRRRKDDQQHD